MFDTEVKHIIVGAVFALFLIGVTVWVYRDLSKNLVTITATAEKQEKKEQQQLEDALSNNYEVYVDGKEVLADNIDFSSYDVTINDKKKKIYCTQKTDSGSSSVFPMFYPLFFFR